MAFNLTARASGKTAMRPKNRVWGFSRNGCDFTLENGRRCPEVRRKPRPTLTFFTPGIPQWPSRDPIGEWGGVNVYGFVGNSALVKVDRVGQDPVDLGDGDDFNQGWGGDPLVMPPVPANPFAGQNVPIIPGIQLPPNTIWRGIAVLRLSYEVDLKCIGCCAASMPLALLFEECQEKLRSFMKYGMSFERDVEGFSIDEGANGNLAELNATEVAEKLAEKLAPPLCYLVKKKRLVLNASWVIWPPII